MWIIKRIKIYLPRKQKSTREGKLQLANMCFEYIGLVCVTDIPGLRGMLQNQTI